MATILLYALFSSPTPDNPHLVEGIIGGLLIVSVGWRPIYALLNFIPNTASRNMPLWISSGHIYTLFIISVPCIVSVLMGNNIALILRDVIPALFIALPVLLALQGKHSSFFTERKDQKLLIGFCALGVIFALRAMAEQYGFIADLLNLNLTSNELTYFANMPSVLFAALFLSGLSYQLLFNDCPRAPKKCPIRLLSAITTMAMSLLIMLPIITTAQRASIGYFLVFHIIMLGIHAIKRPVGTFVVLALYGAGIALIWPNIMPIIDTLIQKTQLVGMNNRLDEASAVWQVLSENPLHILIGQGWGATFSAPTTNGAFINFTHNIFTAALLKTGLIGTGILALYLGSITRRLISLITINPVLGLALAGPFLIDTTLYASYKSLDFGLLLLLIVVAAHNPRPRS